MRFAVFSGRFDPIHLGHFQTIVNIAKEYDHVLVPILDYPERLVPAKRVKKVFDRILDDVIPLHNITVVINDVHFGKITEKQYNNFLKEHIGIAADVTYLTGNKKVLKHFKDMGLKHEHFERSIDFIYEGTKLRGELEKYL